MIELVRRLAQRYRAGLFGTRLMARLAWSFTLMTVIPGLLIISFPQHKAWVNEGPCDPVYLAPNAVNLRLAQERYPAIRFMATREMVREAVASDA